RVRNLILDAMATHLKENSVGALAHEPAGVVDVAAGIKPISLLDETIRAKASAPLRGFARRHALVAEELAFAEIPDPKPSMPSARMLAGKDAEGARRPRQHSFDLGSRLSEFHSAHARLVGIAAAVAILVPAAVITAVWNEIEQGPPNT